MARITPVKNKDGIITSYQIRVFRGKDENGKELKPYSMHWKVPATYKSEKAIQKALQKVAGEFESQCKHGLISSDRRTFAQYAEYFIELKKRDCKRKTIEFYKNLMPRIISSIGCIKLSALTAEDLNKFYLQLESPSIRQDQKAVAKESLILLKKEKGFTHSQLETFCNLSSNTIRMAFQKRKVSINTATKIADAFQMRVSDLFDIEKSGNGKGLSPKSIHHYHKLIHDILALALSEGIVTRNVADAAKPPKLKHHEATFFEIDELLQIREALNDAPTKYKIMLYILIETGCRRGELVGLRWCSVNFSDNTLCLENNLQYSKSVGLYADTLKGNTSHTISISPDLTKMLKQYKIAQEKYKLSIGIPDYNNDGYLFIQESGKPMHPDTLNSWMRKFEKKYNLPHMHPHKFRHSQASILYASGIDIVTISKRLGHKQVSTTQDIYAHLMKESDRKASNAIMDALNKKQA